MSVMLRTLLIAASVLTMLVMMHQIRRSKVQIEDSFFWLAFALMLIVFSVWPGLVYRLSYLAGTMAPSNFIFLLIIFLLMYRLFKMTIRISRLENRVQELIQKQALDEQALDEQERVEAQKQVKDSSEE